MQARLQELAIRLTPYLNRLTELLQLGLRQVIRAWRWFQSIDLPLSTLQWIVLFYVIFGFLYLWATPIFEASDERLHFGMVEYIAETGELPVQDPTADVTNYGYVGSQPPLYYLLSSVVISPIDISDVDSYRIRNPHVVQNNLDHFGNKNIMLREDPHPAPEGTALAVYLLRAVGIGFGIITIITTYHIAQFIAPQRPIVKALSAILVGLNPMFLFMSASVNNLSLAMALNSLVIYLLLQTIRIGFDLRWTLALAGAFALATLTDLSAYLLIPVIVVAGYYAYRKHGDQRGLLIFAGATLAFFAVISGWWIIRNLSLYSEPFGTGMMAQIAVLRPEGFNVGVLLSEFQDFRLSYWGVFGVFNIQTSPMFYILMDLMVFFAIIGFIFLVMQLLAIRDFAYARYELVNLGILYFIFFLGIIGILFWTAQTPASRGQSLFPFITAISPLIAVGFIEVIWWLMFTLRPPDRDFVRAEDAVPADTLREGVMWPARFIGLIALIVPLSTIAPNYAPPEALDKVPDNAIPVYARYGDLALVGYSHIDRRYQPGESATVTLYWEVLEQSDTDYSLALNLVKPNGEVIGAIDTFPGAGLLRTSTWEEGGIYPDRYQIPILSSAFGHDPIRLKVDWWNRETNEFLIITNTENQLIDEVQLNMGAVVALRTPFSLEGMGLKTVPQDLRPSFDATLQLTHVGLDTEANDLILAWNVNGSPTEDYTVFVHILDEDDNIVAQGDTFPDLPTHYWRWGESYVTVHDFGDEEDDFDFDTLRIGVGWYLNDGDELPRLEYEAIVDEEQEFFDIFIIPLEEIEALDPESTEEATAESTEESTAEATDEPESDEATPEPTDNPDDSDAESPPEATDES